MKQLTSRQICMMFCLSVISLKFLVYPAVVTRYASYNSYISVIFGVLIDLIIVIGIALIMKKFPDLTLKQLLIENVGHVVFYIVYALLFVYCSFKVLLAVKEVHHYFLEFLYDDFSWLWFSIPLLTLMWYTTYKGARSVGRTVELLFIFVIIGIFATLLVPIKDVQLSYLLPAFSSPKGIFEGLFRMIFSFGDWIILLLFMGDVKGEKIVKNIVIFAVVAYLFVIAFYIIYVCLFRQTGVAKPYAFSDLPLYTDLPSNSGRIDWISTIIWTFTLILQACMMCMCAGKVVSDMIPKCPAIITSTVVVAVVLGGMLAFYLNLSRLVAVLISPAFCICAMVVQCGIPLIVLGCVIAQCVKGSTSTLHQRSKTNANKSKKVN